MLKGHWPAILSTLLVILILNIATSQKSLSDPRSSFAKQLSNGIVASLFFCTCCPLVNCQGETLAGLLMKNTINSVCVFP